MYGTLEGSKPSAPIGGITSNRYADSHEGSNFTFVIVITTISILFLLLLVVLVVVSITIYKLVSFIMKGSSAGFG